MMALSGVVVVGDVMVKSYQACRGSRERSFANTCTLDIPGSYAHLIEFVQEVIQRYQLAVNLPRVLARFLLAFCPR
jgi:hypothetical protein